MRLISCLAPLLFAAFYKHTAANNALADTVLEFEAEAEWEPFRTCTGVDSMPIAWYNRRANTSYFMAALHERMVAATAPTLDRPPTACSGAILTSHDAHGFDSGPQSYANFQWLQSIRVFANGTAAGLVHNEFKGEFAPLGKYCAKQCADRSPVNASGCRDVVCEIWSTGLASSTDGGTTFKLVANPPDHLVAALPHQYRWNQPISGYGAVSSMLCGADGACYGLINVVNDCENSSSACGNIPAGNCIWRANDLRDPASFRARDQAGNFTVQWASAYAPGGEGKGACATLPVTTDGPFGKHVVFRKIVPRANQSGGSIQPTFIALGDVPPANGRVKYSLSYEQDFGVAMLNINKSWTKPRFLDLDGIESYHYPTILDTRSPQLGEVGGSVESQEDGDSFALVSYPTTGPPRPGPVASVRVEGAGSSACNGLYMKAAVPPGFDSVSHYFRLDANHSIYQNNDVWHLARLGVDVWYSSTDPSPLEGSPPSTGWFLAGGNEGKAPAPSSVVGIPGPNITGAVSTLYLYLRGPTGIMRRKVQLRDTAESPMD
jgi:hypothetical protein